MGIVWKEIGNKNLIELDVLTWNFSTTASGATPVHSVIDVKAKCENYKELTVNDFVPINFSFQQSSTGLIVEGAAHEYDAVNGRLIVTLTYMLTESGSETNITVPVYMYK